MLLAQGLAPYPRTCIVRVRELECVLWRCEMDYMTLKEAASLLTVQPMLFRIFTGFLLAFLVVCSC